MKYFKREIFKYLIIVFVLFLLFQISFVYADNLGNWSTYLEKTAGSEGAGYNTNATSFDIYIRVITNTALSLLGVIFLLLMVYGGYLWMTDRGNSDQVDKAKKLMSAAIIGLIIVISAYAISYFVISRVGENTLEGSNYTPYSPPSGGGGGGIEPPPI